MKLLTAQQIRDWDEFTILHEPLTSVDLMERAAAAFVSKMLKVLPLGKDSGGVKIFCGLGNNGGDGLAIARILSEKGIHVEVFIIEYSKHRSSDFKVNEKRLHERKTVLITSLNSKLKLPAIKESDIIIDALFGTGLNKPLEGLGLNIVQHINEHSTHTVAVDIPSGLPSDVFSIQQLNESDIIHAKHTLTFQLPKQSFLYAETFKFVGQFHVLDIGLHAGYLKKVDAKHFYLTIDNLPLIRQREKFAHKGSYGHAICIGGSYGKIGADILMSKACLRAGAGLVTAYVPKVGYTILQTTLPEAMVLTDDELYEIRHFPDMQKFDAVGIGPGLGTNEYTEKSFYKWIIDLNKYCVIDADALNICAKLLLEHHSSFHFPEKAILTPHPKEFDRLAGVSLNSLERIEKQFHFAQHHHVVVVLKGAHTSIATPDGKLYFNSTGNPAMATAGSGDVLTGVITSFLAQGYEPVDAALLGVYLHGAAGDLAAKNKSTIIASDIIEELPVAIKQIEK